MAAYSPPMPAPVKKRATNYLVEFIENAVSTVARKRVRHRADDGDLEPVEDPHGPRPITIKITINQCHRDHGSRSSRAGMSVVIRPVSAPVLGLHPETMAA